MSFDTKIKSIRKNKLKNNEKDNNVEKEFDNSNYLSNSNENYKTFPTKEDNSQILVL